MNKIPALSLAIALATAPLAALRADDITDQLDAARAAYQRGELQASVRDLQFVIGAIQEQINLSLLKLLPEPLTGWTAEDPQATSGGVATMITGTNLSREYRRQDCAHLEINLTANSPFLSMMTMMLSNPMMIQSDPNSRLYSYAGRRGVIRHNKDNGSLEINLVGSGNLLIRITGTGITKADAEAYLQAMDLTAVEKAFGSA
jgi:hypothetical protein